MWTLLAGTPPRIGERDTPPPHSLLVVPLLHDDRPVGVVTVLDRRDGRRYDVADLDGAALFADLALSARSRPSPPRRR
jgi:GAF domain-containing protein